ncbi:MAG: CO dehydrogenase/acetyl-CoA synthase complex subunit alpha [Methanophagales archaeon]|nr:CO dehydrogenase/acetyl-CoA synthase complex subunit alpha [Methanophagales archaeon]MCW3141555.1 CO dehydrogenase/acetyl-CoA synthase complex subunit alpha [Methanophagales archaeon]
MEALKKGRIFTISDLQNVRISIGEIVEEEREWEPMGPTPMPSISTLRGWDFTLLNRYKPFYAPFCDMCCLCTYGKCDLSGNKKGACGIRMDAQHGRIVLLACLVGCSAHCGHGRHLLHDMIKKFGGDVPIDFGPEVDVEAPLTRLVCGIKPKTIRDYEKVFDYIEEQIVQLADALHTGQEGSYMDFESKALHMGMLDSLSKEAADIIQIACYGMPTSYEGGGPDVPLVDVGIGTIDMTKPVVLVIGHNVPPAADIGDYLTENGLEDKVELAGICCTSIDTARVYKKAKIAAALGRQLRVIRMGIADVIVVDEQCIRADILELCQRVHSPLIVTNDKAMHGLVDRTDDDADKIVDDLVSGRVPGVVILDPEQVGEVAVKTVIQMDKKRKGLNLILSDEEFTYYVNDCIQCGNCTLACPNGLRIGEANQSAASGTIEPLANLFDLCVGCGRCEQVCKKHIPIIDVITKAAYPQIKEEKGRMRIGRGPVWDSEIRDVGAPIVLGTIPGIIAPIGCGNYPNGTKDAWLIVKEFAERNYIITLTGCMAIDAALWKDEEGKTVYEQHHGRFDAGGVLNIGSCVSNAHIHDAAIKVASIFAGRPLRGNYEEIADYILSRVGACGVAWGAMSQKAASIATGFNRLGVPAVVGPHGAKYRRAFLGRPDLKEDWKIIDATDGSEVYVEPGPQDLLVACETVEEALPMMAKLCFRPSDTDRGRSIKLTHYIDLNLKYLNAYPPDWHLFVRTATDLPIAKKAELLKKLEDEQGWEIDWKMKKIKEGPIRGYDPSFNPTNLKRLIREKK